MPLEKKKESEGNKIISYMLNKLGLFMNKNYFSLYNFKY
jgi:hypothetical protein